MKRRKTIGSVSDLNRDNVKFSQELIGMKNLEIFKKENNERIFNYDSVFSITVDKVAKFDYIDGNGRVSFID